MMKSGRTRWKVENESNNILKNQSKIESNHKKTGFLRTLIRQIMIIILIMRIAGRPHSYITKNLGVF